MQQVESKEVRREKVFIPAEMTTQEIRKKFGLSQASANNTKKRILRQKLHGETDPH